MIQNQPRHYIAIGIAFIALFMDIFYLRDTVIFVPFLFFSVMIAWFQYWLDLFMENRKQKEIEEQFPNFVRNFVGTVKSGMPVSKAIVHVADTDYGALTPYVKKLANQIEWSIPVHRALVNFAESTENRIIRRAVATVIEAEQSGGNIEDVLDRITDSLLKIKEIRDKRRASIHNQVLQSYIIFIVFLGVMVIIQNMLIPYITEIQGISIGSLFNEQPTSVGILEKVEIDFSSIRDFIVSTTRWLNSLYGVFLMLTVIQGFFAGVVIGKLSEGQMKFGLKHSLILMSIGFLIISFAQGFI